MRFAWVSAWACAFALVCAACLGDTREARTNAAIHIVCECSDSPLPKAQDVCVERLTIQRPNFSDACLDCVLGNAGSCTDLLRVCENLCQQPQPTERETP